MKKMGIKFDPQLGNKAFNALIHAIVLYKLQNNGFYIPCKSMNKKLNPDKIISLRYVQNSQQSAL